MICALFLQMNNIDIFGAKSKYFVLKFLNEHLLVIIAKILFWLQQDSIYTKVIFGYICFYVLITAHL